MADVGLPRPAGLLAATAEPEPPRTVEPGGAGSWERFWYGEPTGGRAYALYLPRRQPRAGTMPLVIALHGCMQSPEDAAAGTRLNELADREGFAVVYPEQDTRHNRRRCWNWFRAQHQTRRTGEPAAIAGIVTTVLREEKRVDLDPTRVYVLGLSAGGAMASVLAATYPDLFAAVGIHSGLQYGAAQSAPSAVYAMRRGGPDPERQGLLAHAAMGRHARAVPVVVVHGEADETVSAANGELVVRQWLATARAASAGELDPDFHRPDHDRGHVSPGGLHYSVRRWHAAGRPLAEYWLISGLGHAWSGGAAAGSYTDPRGPDATAAIYRFLRRHSLDADPTPRPRGWARLRRLLRTT
jgi:poly(hydroxyalkanoate) depolymerase family esterase